MILGKWHAEDEMDEDDGGDDEDEMISFKVSGFIQYARVSCLPFLLEQLTSHRKTSSQLSLCNRSFWRSLSTLWIMHSRLLSTFTQTFSWEETNGKGSMIPHTGVPNIMKNPKEISILK